MARRAQPLPYVVLGVGVWVLVHESALHATLAGVVLGLLAPTRPFRHPDMVDADELADVSTVRTAEETVVLAASRSRSSNGSSTSCTRGAAT